MSDKRRRSETSWEKKEESKLEPSDGVMSSDFSGRRSREPLQGNVNMPKDDIINRERRRMQTDPAFDEWEKQYSTHQSNDNYGSQPYRGRDKGIGGRGRMSRDRDRSRSPKQSRSRSRSPFRNDRQDSYVYKKESWSRRPDYSGGSRYGDNRNSSDRSRNRGSDGYKKDSGLDEDVRDIAKEAHLCKDFMRGRCHRGASCRFPHHGASGEDYHRDDRNVYDDQDHRRQSNRNSRAPCKFFAMGKCSRDDCKFSHDGPEPGCYNGRSHDRNLGNKNRIWNDGQPQDDLNAPDFAKSNHYFDDKKKSWNGPSWDDVESGGFNERSRDIVQDHTSDDKNRKWDGPVPGDASGFSDVPKSKHNFDDKKKSRDGPSWDYVGSPNFGKSNPNLDYKKGQWNRSSWNEVSASGLSNVPKPCHNSEDNRKDSLGASGSSCGAKSANNIDGKMKSWNGLLWDEVSDGMLQTDEKNVINDFHAKNFNRVSEDTNQQVLTSGKESVQGVDDMSSQSLLSLSGAGQSHNMLLSNSFNGPVQGMLLHMGSHKQTEFLNKEGGKPQEPLEIDVLRVMNDMNETSVISEQVSQLNGLPASLPELSQNAQAPQVYTKLNLTNAIDYLNSLPISASSVPCIDPMVFQHNQDTRPKEQYGSARNMEVGKSIKGSVPMGILSGSVRQENQMPVETFPPISNLSKLSEIGVVEKEYRQSPKTKKQEPVGNPEGTESKVAENAKQEQENINPDNSEAQGKVEEGGNSNEEKAMRQFKLALAEFVKEILKPTWKEGKMSREVHKTIVKKVVDKVTSTIQGIQIPKTQAKIEQYLAFSKSKITKLVEAYVERFLKA